jgi:uncharacterized membrane protein YqjE
MDIERQLRDSLAARDPGAEFDEAVLAKLALARQRPARRNWRVPAALAATLVLAAVGVNWRLTQQRQERAGEQLMLALQITSYQLNQVQRKLARTATQEDGI